MHADADKIEQLLNFQLGRLSCREPCPLAIDNAPRWNGSTNGTIVVVVIVMDLDFFVFRFAVFFFSILLFPLVDLVSRFSRTTFVAIVKDPSKE